jgi:hypothetical protein
MATDDKDRATGYKGEFYQISYVYHTDEAGPMEMELMLRFVPADADDPRLSPDPDEGVFVVTRNGPGAVLEPEDLGEALEALAAALRKGVTGRG